MRNSSLNNIIFDSSSKLQAAFTAATTDIITSNAHGLKRGDVIHVASSTALPAGLSASTNYYVRDITTNTFKLSTVLDGPVVNITDTGTGTHTFYLKGKSILVADFTHMELSINASDSPAFNIKVQKSDQDNVDFNASQGSSNRWVYADIVDTSTAGTVTAGDTGVTFTGTASNKSYEVNINGAKWITLAVSGWSAGALHAVLSAYNNQ